MRKLLLPALTVILFSCATSKTSVTSVQRIPVRFDFDPPSRAKSGATNLTIALLRPVFVGEQHPEYYVAPFNEMAISMGNDFQELLTAKGFTIKGPFKGRDEMTFTEKNTSDLAIEVHIVLNPMYNTKYNVGIDMTAFINPLRTASYYNTTGEITLAGYLELNARSPQFGELLWKKKIELDRASFTYAGKLKWDKQPSIADELKQDNEVYNIISKELEKYYLQAMNLSWQQIDAAEMKQVADQAKKADKKSQ